MFVYYYAYLSRPFEDVDIRLLEVLSGLNGFAADAYRDGEAIRAKIGAGEAPAIAKTVILSSGPPQRAEHKTVVPITWEATGTPGLFPRMDADIVVARMAPGLTQVALRGTYTPPLGPVGRILDRALFHRLAEAGVKSFVDRLVKALETQAAPVSGVRP